MAFKPFINPTLGPMAPFAPSVWTPPAPPQIQDFSQPDYSFAPIANFQPIVGNPVTPPIFNGRDFTDPNFALENIYTPPSNAPQTSINNAMQRLAAAGQEIPARDESSGGLLSTVMGALEWVDNRTRGPVVTFADEIAKGGSFGKALGEGGKVFIGSRDAASGSDLIRDMGMPEDAFLTHVLGFGVDVVADPTTWLSAGASSVGKQLGKAGLMDAGIASATTAAERALIEHGVLDTGGQLGKEALGEYLGIARQNYKEVSPGLNTALSAAESTTNRSLSHTFGAGAADVVRGMDGGIPGFMQDLSQKMMNGIPDLASTMPKDDLLGRVADKLERAGSMLTADRLADLEKLGETQLAAIDTLVDVFGSHIAVDKLTVVGSRLGDTTKKGVLKGVKKVNQFMEKTFATEMDAIKAIEEAKAPIAGAQKLIATVDKGDLWLKIGVPFTGKTLDLIEITPIKTYTGKALQGIYNASPTVQVISDWLGESFITKYLKGYTRLMPAETQAELGEAASKIYNFNREQRASLGMATRETVGGLDVKGLSKSLGTDVFETAMAETAKLDPGLLKRMEISSIDDISARLAFGPELAGNAKVMEAVPYYLERAIQDGGDDAAGILSFSGAKWQEIAKTLSPEELRLVEEAAAKSTLLHEITKQIDFKILGGLSNKSQVEAIKGGYTLPGSEYVTHLYDFKGEVPFTTIVTQEGRVTAAISPKHAAMKARTIKSIAQAEALYETLDETGQRLFSGKPIKNMALLTSARLSYTRRALAASQLIEDLKGLEGIVSTGKILPGLKGEAKALTEAFAGTEVQAMKHVASQLNGFYAHPEVVRHLRTLDNLMFNDAAQNQFLNWVSTVTNYVKGAQLSLNASFTIRNITGEGFMAFVDGVGPGSIKEAIKGLTGTKGALQIGRRSLDAKEEVTAFGKLGGWFGGSRARDFVTGAKKTLEQEIKVATKGGIGINPLLNINDFNDKMWRFAHYLHYRGQGFGIRDAVMKVRGFHVDYQDLTKFEKNVARNVIPFYTYMRKNMPNVIRMVMEQPFAYSITGHLVNSAHKALGNPETSDYLNHTLALPLFRLGNGDTALFNWNLPIADLARLKNPFTKDGFGEFAKSLNPLASVSLQLMDDKNWATGRSISRFPSDYGSRAKFAIDQLGSVPRAITGSDLAKETLGLRDQGLNTPDQLPLTLSSAFPIQRPVSVYTSNQYKYRDQLLDEIARHKSKGQSIPTIDMLR